MTSQPHAFEDLVDIQVMREILQNLYAAAGIPSAIIDMRGRVLAGAGWQRICLQFHRRHPEAQRLCVQSDIKVRAGAGPGRPFSIYECPHGLVDSCCPVVIEGEHLANVFTGQFLHVPPDEEMIGRFRAQAGRYGFDEADYLAALREVPVFSLRRHEAILAFLSGLAEQMANIGLNNLRAQELKNRLQESEATYRSLFRNNHSVMLVIDPESGDIVDANPAARAFYGFGSEDWKRLNITDINILSPDEVRTEMRRAKNGSRRHFLFRHRLASGEVRDVEVYSGPVLRRGRRLLYSIIHDVTERLEAERRLRRSEKEWEQTFDAMQDIVTLQDRERRIVKANKAAREFFGAGRDGLCGRFCYDLFRGVDRPCPECPGTATLEDGRGRSETVTHPGMGRIFSVSIAPVRDEDDGLGRIVHVARDITEHKKLEDELFQAHKMEAIGTLAGGIAHDFNNILTAIIGYADLARDGLAADSQAREFLDQVLRAGARAKELVRQILTFGRRGAEGMHPLNPSPVIKEAVKLLRSTLPSTISIRETIDAGCGYIVADPTKVHQVLVNLCTNALHAMEEEQGLLDIRLEHVALAAGDTPRGHKAAPGPYVRLTVKDTGRGMTKEVMERIFEPYFTTKPPGKGTGMGLALVQGIVETSGGFIRVWSEPGRGTAFSVFWPEARQRDDTAGAPASGDSVALPAGGGEHVMLVDDEPEITAMYRAFLEPLGYRVSVFGDGEAALAAFRADPADYDLVLTDQTMPRLPGHELARKILSLRPEVPVILCTGYSALVSQRQAEELGVAAFLLKPLSRVELARRVRRALDGGGGEERRKSPD